MGLRRSRSLRGWPREPETRRRGAVASTGLALLLGASLTAAIEAPLALPPAGTTSRERSFCRSWLALSNAERAEVLARDEALAAGTGGADGAERRACRERLRAGVRRKLDAECRNWPELMDFEVRGVVEAVLEACAKQGT